MGIGAIPGPAVREVHESQRVSLWLVGQVCDLAFRLAEAAYSTASVRKAG
jgi:hypothetical protein